MLTVIGASALPESHVPVSRSFTWRKFVMMNSIGKLVVRVTVVAAIATVLFGPRKAVSQHPADHAVAWFNGELTCTEQPGSDC